jgi:hypothetical protein
LCINVIIGVADTVITVAIAISVVAFVKVIIAKGAIQTKDQQLLLSEQHIHIFSTNNIIYTDTNIEESCFSKKHMYFSFTD